MGSQLPKTMISVIIPARNEEKYLEKTLQSVKSQTVKPKEIIVVANACTDKTAEIAKKYTNKVLTTKKTGVSHARNLGAEKARGGILVFLDADVLLPTNTLKKIQENFSKDYSVGTLTAKPDTNMLWHKMLVNISNTYRRNLYPSSYGVIISRKEKFQKTKGFNEEMNVKENREIVKKLMKHGKYLYLNEPATVSMRRYQQWGPTKLAKFWIQKNIENITGKIKNKKYEVVR